MALQDWVLPLAGEGNGTQREKTFARSYAPYLAESEPERQTQSHFYPVLNDEQTLRT